MLNYYERQDLKDVYEAAIQKEREFLKDYQVHHMCINQPLERIMKNIETRNRDGEQGISRVYVSQLQ